jgi:hypothetical protein
MDPYLEQADVWQDFHDRLLPAIAEVITPQVDPAYIVRIEAQLYVHEPPAESRRLFARGDVAVSTRRESVSASAASATLPAPRQIELLDFDVERISRLKIRDRVQRHLVTVLEVLSPTNKTPGADRQLYLAKRRANQASRTHFVEIDLLRGGPRMPMLEPPICDYCVLVSRQERWPFAGIWPIQLRESLPEIPIPLLDPDPDAKVDLQAVLQRVYDAARYQSSIYEGVPEPPLSPTDAAWAESLFPK